MFLHCCILIVFSPHMCLSTLENKMWFFFFRFTWKYNKAQIHHSWSHTLVWYSLDLTHTIILTHTHSSSSVCGHCPGEHQQTGRSFGVTYTTRHSDLSVSNTEAKLKQWSIFLWLHGCFYLALLLKAAHSLVSINRHAVLEVINTLWTIH